MNIYIHIGEKKCASSSVQQYFSKRNAQDNFTYGAIDSTGKMIYSSSLRQEASLNAVRYMSCHEISTTTTTTTTTITKTFIDNLTTSLSECSKKYSILLLSDESLRRSLSLFSDLSCVFEKYTVKIIYIVRPPVAWLNGSYWQWEHWNKEGIDIDKWLNSACPSKDWLKTYKEFNALPYVKKTYFFTLQNNIIEQLCRVMGIEYHEKLDCVSNQSPSLEYLAFTTMKRSLRPNAETTWYSFVFNDYLKKRSPTPWILSHENVKMVLKNTKQYNLKLSKLIQNENILENKAWWDIDFYEEKILQYNRTLKLSFSSMADMLEESYHIIYNLDAELKKLRYELSKNKKNQNTK